MDLYAQALAAARRYAEDRSTRAVFPTAEALEGLGAFESDLPDDGLAEEEVLALLDRFGSPASVMSSGGRYFGFVTGSSLPAATAAHWLATAWDQNSALAVMSPVVARLDDIALSWIADLLGIPPQALGTFVTGATMANFTCLAAARHSLLQEQGWDVEAKGMFGAPAIPVIVGEEAHVSLLKALRLLGFGTDSLLRVPADSQGRMRPDAFPTLTTPALVCLQAGNVNTGALDPAESLIPLARASGSWVHVDGAFGLWANASASSAPLAAGYEQADSWASDCHKWLNVPYDSGVAFVRSAAALVAAMGSTASYLPSGGTIEAMQRSPESSRRARGVDAWAALRSLGKKGVAELVDRCCHHARSFAGRLEEAGCQILNEVALNQVLVALDSDERTTAWIEAVQRDGACWCGGTVWQGRKAMRISVSSWATTRHDVKISVESMLRCRPA
ncbi:pyridoxal phosphate-dependent decarboxylase family protein [Bryobacter aggregatus]|uniref:pyridoxal phosphate-dependent decarboxylase family protein n=1 Tax=Bryobacter aggregatus TaxID=360054 RepID=UPI000562F4E8|nr:pyridoxal-dependent decarboxylase [Bryobacter aggregatus]